jgi:hypothetical protein
VLCESLSQGGLGKSEARSVHTASAGQPKDQDTRDSPQSTYRVEMDSATERFISDPDSTFKFKVILDPEPAP